MNPVDVRIQPDDRHAYSMLMSLYAGIKPAFLQQALASVADQTVAPDELVIVYDGPLPAELEDVVARFKESVPFDVRVVRLQQHGGLGPALAAGIEACTHELVAVMDADDIATPDRMSKTLAAFEAQPALDLVGSQAVEFKETLDNPCTFVELPTDHDGIVAFSKRRTPFRQPSVTFRKSRVLEAGNYNGAFPYFEDWDLFNRMLARGCQAANLPDACLYVRSPEDFFMRRGGVRYAAHMTRFKVEQWRRGYFSAKDLVCSLGPHLVVCLMPNGMRTWVYTTFLRKPARMPSARKRVLVYTESWGIGGIESSIIDAFELLADAAVDFTLFSVWKWNDGHDSELKELGVPATFLFDERRSLAVRCLCGWRAFARLLKQDSYDAVHVHTMNGAGLVYARIAALRGVPIVIAHSRNSRYSAGHSIAKAAAHAAGKVIGASAATARLAVSKEAGRYLFGKRGFRVLKRGLDTQAYAFDPEARQAVRTQLGIGPTTYVVGNIGRVSEAKNVLFQVRAFAEFHRRVHDSVLLLVGDGDMRAQRDAEIERLGIADAVVTVGLTSEPASYYSAMDCFILPSLYEGLPNAALEAQCAGLPTLISDAVTDEAFVTDIAFRCPLAAGEAGWAGALEALADNLDSGFRAAYAEKVKQAGFSREAYRSALAELYGVGVRVSQGT